MKCIDCRKRLNETEEHWNDGFCFSCKEPSPEALEENRKRIERNARARQNRATMTEAYRSCGMNHVRINGKDYWE